MGYNDDKLKQAAEHLHNALAQYQEESNALNFLTVTKAFEIVVEYGWRLCKRFVEDQGLEAQSPKAALREAARLDFITSPELWIECLNTRNHSVHDYFGIPESDFVALASKLLDHIPEL